MGARCVSGSVCQEASSRGGLRTDSARLQVAETLVDGEVARQPLDVFIAGDDADAKATVSELARSGGLNPVDAEPPRRARELEAP